MSPVYIKIMHAGSRTTIIIIVRSNETLFGKSASKAFVGDL